MILTLLIHVYMCLVQWPSSFKALGEKISSLEGEKQRVEGELASLRSQLEERGSALEQARTELGEAGRRHEEVCGALKAELRGVKSQLSAATSTGLDLGERLREVRRVKRELSQELATMHTSSSKTEVARTVHSCSCTGKYMYMYVTRTCILCMFMYLVQYQLHNCTCTCIICSIYAVCMPRLS